MLGNAKLPHIGSPRRLKLRALTVDATTVILHINIPWLLGGDDQYDLPGSRECQKWGWEVVSFWCKGQKLIKYASPTNSQKDILDMADPKSNKRLRDMVSEGIEKARLRQSEYAKREQ